MSSLDHPTAAFHRWVNSRPGRCPRCEHAAHDPGPCMTPSKYGCRECSNEPAKGNQP